MNQTNSQTPPAEFDPERLQSYLRGLVPDLRGAIQLERIGGGQSNPTFFVSFDNRRLVLRKQPGGGNLLPSAHAVDREHRILNALARWSRQWDMSKLADNDDITRLMAWHTAPGQFGGIRGLDLQALELPSQDEYLYCYMRCSGRLDGMKSFHLVFSLFRFAVILEGIAARARAGNAAAHNAAQVGAQAAAFARTATELIDGAATS